VGVVYDVNKKIAQGFHGGTRQIIKVHTLSYHLQEITYMPNMTVMP